MSDYYSEHLTFDGDNSFPDCEGCGKCCEYMYVMAVTPEELQRMKDYVAEHNIEPIDYDRKLCPFRGSDGLCRIWEARPQICKLHHCKVPRTEIVRQNPNLVIPEDLPLVDLYDVFFNHDDSDPRYRKMVMTPLGKFLLALLIVVVLAVSGYFVACKAAGLDRLLSAQELVQLVSGGSIQERTQVDAPPCGYAEGSSPLSYRALYQDDQGKQNLYQETSNAYTGFQKFYPNQQLTWVDAGFDVSTTETATSVGQMFHQVMMDNPCYSVQYPAAPLAASSESSYSVVSAGSRFMMESLYLPPINSQAVSYYRQVCDRVKELSQQADAQCDGTDYGYIKSCFSLLASGMVYSRGDDNGPWYSNNIYGALLGGESECSGMSDALKALLDAKGIPNFVATGRSRGTEVGHAWNVIYYDGGWFICDLTRCVADVVMVAEDGSTERVAWQIGNVPDLETPMSCVAAGFMVSQVDYLSGKPVMAPDGKYEYTFGDAIVMDEAGYQVEAAYEALL